ncbi:MAG: hypothetical protein IPI06_07400 [Gammaproteobacteria bacterium]|nr:hypothetical protein [Gammaproteobacteria bacterium]
MRQPDCRRSNCDHIAEGALEEAAPGDVEGALSDCGAAIANPEVSGWAQSVADKFDAAISKLR